MNTTQQQYQLAAIDLDGTILAHDGAVSARNRQALDALVAAGVTCVIASGRMYHSTLAVAKSLGVSSPIIAYNGAMVRDPRAGDEWRHITVPAEPAADIVRLCQSHAYHLNYCLDDRLYVAEAGRWGEFYRRHTGVTMDVVGDLTVFDGRRPTKLILIDAPDVTARLLNEMRARYDSQLYVTLTNPEYLEFMHPSVNKGEALRLVADRLGVEQRRVLAFGDGANDAPMLAWAGFGVAMGSGSTAAREAADWIAPGLGDDGFAVAVQGILSGEIGRLEA